MNSKALEKHLKIAKGYEYLCDLRKFHKSTYTYFANTGNLDMISHLKKVGNRLKRCVYVFLFDDNSYYVGLTYNIKKREAQHLSKEKSPVFKKVKKGVGYELVQLTDYIDSKDAQTKECYYINKFEDKGFVKLNTQKGGNLGCREKKHIDIKEIFNKASICRNTDEMNKKYTSYYKRACELKIQRELVFSDGKKTGDRYVTWKVEDVMELSKKCKNATEMKSKNPGAYRHAVKNKYTKKLVYGK